MIGREYSERDIHMALDGELPAEEVAGYEAWLAANPEMKARSARYEADLVRLRQALAPVADEPVPPRLKRFLSDEPAIIRRLAGWRSLAAAVVILAVGAAGGYLAGRFGADPEAGDLLAEQAIAAHSVYSAEQRHAVEVGADDRPHLLGWLSERTGLKLVAPDLAAQGFDLVGGRLLPSGRKPAALLLYQDSRGNRISVYVTGEGEERSRGTYAEAGGPVAVYWLAEGYGCAVVGSLPPEQLSEVARSAYRQILAGAGIG